MKQLAAVGMEDRLAQAIGQIDAILAEGRAATDEIGAARSDRTTTKPTRREPRP